MLNWKRHLPLPLAAAFLMASPAAFSAENENEPGPGKVELELKLPRAAFIGTPKKLPPGTTVEPPKPRGKFFVPKGTTNLALGKAVTSSDSFPLIGELKQVTDGDKEADEGSYVELGAPGVQWVQVDLGKSAHIYAIALWHRHSDPRVYRDVIVQVSDDPEFKTGVTTVFNNDGDNSAGLGIGEHKEFFEHSDGKLIDAKGAKGRYVRSHSNASTAADQNHFTEIEVHGIPVDAAK